MSQDKETISITIQSPDEVVWKGESEALSSENAEGPFDILPGHANFITLIKNTDVTLHLENKEAQTFSFDQAVLFFHQDVAKIYIHTSRTLQGLKSDKV